MKGGREGGKGGQGFKSRTFSDQATRHTEGEGGREGGREVEGKGGGEGLPLSCYRLLLSYHLK
jgi:hypothetical protein